MIFSPYFPGPFEMEDFHFAIRRKIRKEKRKCSEKEFKKLTKKHIQKGGILCTLAKVHDTLTSKGIRSDRCKYSKNDFEERLEIHLAGTDFKLSIPLFPKRDPKKGIALTVGKAELCETIDSDVTPESAADFILGISEWLPEYYGIEKRIKEEEMKKHTIRELALDLLRRNIGAILEEKGYEYSVSSSGIRDKASLRIVFSDVFQMTLEVDLMEDFLEQVRMVAEALPAKLRK